ncbi:hypothetical protein D3C79_697540 [compost metagenome]
MNPAATKPPAAPPNEKPQAARVTIRVRKRGGAYSDISAMALGIAPPMPIPQTKRASIRLLRELAKTISTVRLEYKSTQHNNTRRTPKRSASGVTASDPRVRPSRLALNTGPNAAFSRPQSWAREGIT